VGGKGFLTARLAGSVVEGTIPNWSSSDPSVAVVDESGNVTCVGEGTARIRASVPLSGGMDAAADSVQVTCVAPELITLDTDTISHRHVVGTSPCPDLVGEVALTNASNVEVTVEVASDNPALVGSPDRISLAPGEVATLRLLFNCSVRSGFTAQLTLTTRDAAGRTQVETLAVDVDVV
jgi:hypothetical protein